VLGPDETVVHANGSSVIGRDMRTGTVMWETALTNEVGLGESSLGVKVLAVSPDREVYAQALSVTHYDPPESLGPGAAWQAVTATWFELPTQPWPLTPAERPQFFLPSARIAILFLCALRPLPAEPVPDSESRHRSAQRPQCLGNTVPISIPK